MQRLPLKEILVVSILAVLFIAASWFSRSYEADLFALFGDNTLLSVLGYIGLTILTFVVAPLNALPLFPVTVTLWGALPALFVNLVAWSIGTLLTYALARRFGRPLVLRFVKTETIDRYEKKLSEQNKFVGLVMLHAIFPGDVLGYVLGLFIKISYPKFVLASFIGNIPIALTLVFASSVSLPFQVAIAVVVILVTSFGIKAMLPSKT